MRENFIGDTHLHVVGLAGKQFQRLVLRLPAEAGDGAIIAVVIESAADAEVIVGIGRLIVQQG